MKAITLSLILILSLNLLSQTPEKFYYQTIIKDNNKNLLSNQNIEAKIDILKNSIDGETIYEEIHSVITSDKGLVSFEIGAGNVSLGNFSEIDWACCSYFVKTEINVLNDENYFISNTSQLLSTPYALHAKFADTIINGNISKRYIGELYGGGVVFWVDQSGEHGLILSLADLSTSGCNWSNINDELVGTNDWDGLNNTQAIISQQGHENSAALMCMNYVNEDYGSGIYNDWYLPSITELFLISKHILVIDNSIIISGFGTPLNNYNFAYWSSTEYSSDIARVYFFRKNIVGEWHKQYQYLLVKVRAIRKF